MRESVRRLFLGWLFCLSGCGYQWGASALVSGYRTISIPYSNDDPDGDLTSALIREVARTGAWAYCREGGELTLCVTLLTIEKENIGYQYEPKNAKKKRVDEGYGEGESSPFSDEEEKVHHGHDERNRVKRSTIPTETRLYAVAEVFLIDSRCNKALLGPVQIAGSVDFDHDYYESPDAVNVFSLGQLTDVEQAHEAAVHPLYRNLARNIVEYIRNAW